MTELIYVENESIHVTFPLENVNLFFRDKKGASELEWDIFCDAIDNNLGSNVFYSDYYGYIIKHCNSKISISTYLEEIEFGLTAHILVSDLNRYIFRQLAEAFRCVKNNIEYKWVDMPVSIKSARNI